MNRLPALAAAPLIPRCAATTGPDMRDGPLASNTARQTDDGK